MDIQSLCPELIVDILIRLDKSDIQNFLNTCTYFTQYTHLFQPYLFLAKDEYIQPICSRVSYMETIESEMSILENINTMLRKKELILLDKQLSDFMCVNHLYTINGYVLYSKNALELWWKLYKIEHKLDSKFLYDSLGVSAEYHPTVKDHYSVYTPSEIHYDLITAIIDLHREYEELKQCLCVNEIYIEYLNTANCMYSACMYMSGNDKICARRLQIMPFIKIEQTVERESVGLVKNNISSIQQSLPNMSPTYSGLPKVVRRYKASKKVYKQKNRNQIKVFPKKSKRYINRKYQQKH